MFVALKWDHQIGAHFVSWIVVECSAVRDKFGLPQAIPPRRDIAYFVDPKTAEQDAHAFADHKNGVTSVLCEQDYSPYLSDHHGYAHYQWDHTYLEELVKHAVLYWEDGKHLAGAPLRDDIAYFVCPYESELDSRFFAQYKLMMAGQCLLHSA
ncbi:hypothetical protein [Pseudoalteromonas luteoviolacea]|uniref:Uncharacterized protein n=1 Tax=Pseudoalteromonas luteoviolacea S4054 TaxID=1129367 RepID=A0A0F6AFL6_9GAMM|nr:hypothetical protein [Pseudoalteromonas luteoviolacea]AOT09283.1 hypothetical protein S4054249_16145 [Pseudoalteromonas luteoviolacea]AOT14195.1 hypothetical protein S40542_16115 [Pseudoalteromonas luteoviolacea]AOT19111.1 hypothetical protein S4054_16120 [Pseudoalteromonas luteoviolacea]KKE85000.1 hypothetical protein N479_06095 [Pseudoalteromonas luteoviolacea S4054]KZN70118.1 hypothetical protein N481_01205 [Pseudoalteromonas luteoviolacea S4047-1]